VPTPTVEPAGAVLDRLLTTIEDGHPEALRGLRAGYPDWDRLGPGLLRGASISSLEGREWAREIYGIVGLRSMKT
jgi:hypothetical protein